MRTAMGSKPVLEEEEERKKKKKRRKGGTNPVCVSTDGQPLTPLQGAGPFHGLRSLSTPFRGGGEITAPWPLTVVTATKLARVNKTILQTRDFYV